MNPYAADDDIHPTWMLYHADFVEQFGPRTEDKGFAPEADLIVTSPPYNLEKPYGSSNDGKSYEAYLEWTREWLCVAYGHTKEHGRLCLNIPLDKNYGGHRPVYADLVRVAQEVGWRYFTTIVWNERNNSRRTAWGSFMKATAPYVIAPVEMVAVFYKGDGWKRADPRPSGIRRQDFIEWVLGHWTFPGESAKRIGHPAPFPVELPRRCILLFSFLGDVVLDPFCGSGSTLLAAQETGRVGLGVDIHLSYLHIAESRLKERARAVSNTPAASRRK